MKKVYYDEIENEIDEQIYKLKKLSKKCNWFKYFFIVSAFCELVVSIKNFGQGDFIWAGVFLFVTIYFIFWAWLEGKRRKAQLIATDFLESHKANVIAKVEAKIRNEINPELN